jgi:hypothetical protein
VRAFSGIGNLRRTNSPEYLDGLDLRGMPLDSQNRHHLPAKSNEVTLSFATMAPRCGRSAAIGSRWPGSRFFHCLLKQYVRSVLLLLAACIRCRSLTRRLTRSVDLTPLAASAEWHLARRSSAAVLASCMMMPSGTKSGRVGVGNIGITYTS